MKIQNQPTPIMTIEKNATIFVSIELSKKSWLTGIHTPLPSLTFFPTQIIALRSVFNRLDRTLGNR